MQDGVWQPPLRVRYSCVKKFNNWKHVIKTFIKHKSLKNKKKKNVYFALLWGCG